MKIHQYLIGQFPFMIVTAGLINSIHLVFLSAFALMIGLVLSRIPKSTKGKTKC